MLDEDSASGEAGAPRDPGIAARGESRPARQPRPEDAPLAALDTFIDGMRGDFAALRRDLAEGGFGPYAQGTAKQLHDVFVAAVDGSRKTPSAGAPWKEMRSLAARLAAEGDGAAAVEIVDGLMKRAARHSMPRDFLTRLAADRRAWLEGPARPTAPPVIAVDRTGPDLRADVRDMAPPPRSRSGNMRLGLAALGLLLAVTVAIGGNYAMLRIAGMPDPTEQRGDAPATVASVQADKAAEDARTVRRVGEGVTGAAPAAKPDTTSAATTTAATTATTATNATATTGTTPTTTTAATGTGAAGATTATTTVATTATTPPATDQSTTGTIPPLVAVRTDIPPELVDPVQASRLQARLATLGYLAGPVDGQWGPRSRTALREFKRANGLPADDVFDPRTRGAVYAEAARPALVPASAVEGGPTVVESIGAPGTLTGAWALGPATCTLPAPTDREVLWISSRGLVGSDRQCRVLDIRQTNGQWTVLADCGAGPQGFRFALQGDRLVEIGRGGTVYQRCAPRRADFASAGSTAPVFVPPPPGGTGGSGTGYPYYGAPATGAAPDQGPAEGAPMELTPPSVVAELPPMDEAPPPLFVPPPPPNSERERPWERRGRVLVPPGDIGPPAGIVGNRNGGVIVIPGR